MENQSKHLKHTTPIDEDNKILKMVSNQWNKKEHERVKRGQMEEDKELELNKIK